MSYINEYLDSCFGYGFEGGPMFNTQIIELTNGREKRNGTWAQQKHKYSASFQNITKEDYAKIKRMHMIARGRLHAFKVIDPLDSFANNEVFGAGNGIKKDFQLTTTSSSSGVSYTRGIYGAVVDDDFVVTVNNVVASGYTVDTQRGTISFTTAPANTTTIRWSGNFFVWVRFDDDYLPFTLDNPDATNGSINLIEVAPPPAVV